MPEKYLKFMVDRQSALSTLRMHFQLKPSKGYISSWRSGWHRKPIEGKLMSAKVNNSKVTIKFS